MTIKCKNCGTENGGKSRFCEACGKRLRSGSGSGFGIFIVVLLVLGGYYVYAKGGLRNVLNPTEMTEPSVASAPSTVAPAAGDTAPLVPAPVPTVAPEVAPEEENY